MPESLDNQTARRLLEYFEGRGGEVLALVRALCEAESPSGDLEGSREVVGLLEREAARLPGASFERAPAPDDYGEHLRLRAFDSEPGGARPLLILGHTDTVHPRGTLAERPWRETGGRIYAPGIFDMKASCAVAFAAARACAELGLRPRRPVVLLLTCDEETGSFSGRAAELRLSDVSARKARSRSCWI